MRTSADMYMTQVNKSKQIQAGFRKTQRFLSLMVIVCVFWGLKLTGITMAGEAFCGMEEHVHTENCTMRATICGQDESEGHVHTQDCLQKTLNCDLTEQPGHSHSEACSGATLICTQEETEGHSHTEECFQQTLTCTTPEQAMHIHGADCYTQTFTCGLEENENHQHDETCSSVCLSCDLPESAGHSHGTDCYVKTAVCGKEEAQGHVHSDGCYSTETSYLCGMEEVQEHFHTDACYVIEEETYICGLEEKEEHSHTDTCYESTGSCTLEEHIHTPNCYSDISADLETSADWEKSFGGLICTTNNKENIILIAKSQLEVEESTRNFKVDELGVRRGITRYGQWYGNPYGDWSAMFASFCLDYAGVQGVPLNAGVEAMRLEWETAGLYASAEEHVIDVGQLLFLDKDENGEADSVAIVTDRIFGEENEDVLVAVEGNINEPVTQIGTVKLHSEEKAFEEITAVAGEGFEEESLEETVAVDRVAETMYAVDDPAIMGFGLMPECTSATLMNPTLRAGEMIYLGYRIDYEAEMFTESRSFVIFAENRGQYFAFVSNPTSGMEETVAAVSVEIGDDGKIYTDVSDPSSLLWKFTRNGNTGSNYYIQSVSTGRYLHPGGDYGVIYEGNWPTALVEDGSGAKLVHTSEDNDVGIYYNRDQKRFEIVRDKNNATTLYFGLSEYVVPERCTVWLDGTDGGIASLGGSPNQQYNVESNTEFKLPSEWTSPSKYSYKVRGWYDVTHSKYYQPGTVVTITESTVFYADWVASTYDIGQYNAQVADTVSTNSFITTHMFDYNYLFNIHSTKLEQTMSASSHTDNWHMVTSGNVAHGGQETFDFVFIDNDTTGRICIPHGRSDHNVYPGAGIVTPGIYSEVLAKRLFGTDNCYNPETQTGILGKTYLGTGDHLFQIMSDPTDDHYGYYYYDSGRNAASYNQSNQRFYVYEYLEATSDAIGSTYSDFLPLNSPYANTNGKSVGTYNYAGVNDEYEGVPHYRYDSKYNSGNHNSVNNVTTDYAYGMRSDIQFYLPNDPGEGGNKDLYGNDMQFQFSGDDDLWVLIDEKLVLDIGGIHGAEDGVIDFSTGQITVQDKPQKSLMDLGIGAGDHTLSVLYLERGSSLSNCSIYFNLAPRFGLVIRKEDVLTQKILDGTEFTVYEDFDCTKPAVLWESEEAYQQDRADGKLDEYQSAFTVTGGTANMWGLGSGNTYYIKETKPPAAEGYGPVEGIIRLTIEKKGLTNYKADVIPDKDGNGPSNGFTVHDVRIDEETKTVYLAATNAPKSVPDITTVQVSKIWKDRKNHSGDYITAYLTVTDPDGTVRRIREVILSEENNSEENKWRYTWTNLPKKIDKDSPDVIYGIEESYESGYYSTVRRKTTIEVTTDEWAEAASFIDGESYILKSSRGYLSTTSETDAKLKWETQEATAKTSPLATWTVAVTSDSRIKFTNGAGQILTYNHGRRDNQRYFYATKSESTYQKFTPVDQLPAGFRLYVAAEGTNYYMSSTNVNKEGRISSIAGDKGNESSYLVLKPMKQLTETTEVKDWAYEIINTPLADGNETSLYVKKDWELPAGYDATLYQEEQVTVRLLANGVETGRSVTLNLKGNWEATFLGLPYKDDSGNVIAYEVEEIWEKERWSTRYGEIKTSGSGTPTYTTTITNTYHPGGPELPSTGTAARMLYVLCGGGIMLSSLVYGMILRRKRERRMD